MLRILALLAAILFAAAAEAETARAPLSDRLGTLALIEQDFLREDSRVFQNRERGETIEAALELRAARYRLALQRPTGFEFLLVIEATDGARCPGREIIIVGTRSGRLYQGTCAASISINSSTFPAYYEAELDRLLHLFHPLLAPHAVSQREDG